MPPTFLTSVSTTRKCGVESTRPIAGGVERIRLFAVLQHPRVHRQGSQPNPTRPTSPPSASTTWNFGGATSTRTTESIAMRGPEGEGHTNLSSSFQRNRGGGNTPVPSDEQLSKATVGLITFQIHPTPSMSSSTYSCRNTASVMECMSPTASHMAPPPLPRGLSTPRSSSSWLDTAANTCPTPA